jgi:dephospho-CoA kinase
MRLDHIGSTSVPGLLSKDIIDVQLGVKSLDLGLSAPLKQAGFLISENIRRDHIPPGGLGDPADWAKRFATGMAGRHSVNLHVRRIGASNWRYALLFRDFLRASPVASAAYARAKALLAPLCPSVDVYADAKDPICDLVMLPAAAWAVQTGWNPLED